MSPRERRVGYSPLSAWALRTGSLLRDAGEDGVHHVVLRDELGRPPDRSLAELRRAGWVIGEEHDTYFLVHCPTSTDAPAETPFSHSAVSAVPRPADASVDAGQLQLDDLASRVPHYEEAA